MSRLSPGPQGGWTKTAPLQELRGRATPPAEANGGGVNTGAAMFPYPGLPLGLTPRQLECLAWVAEGKSAIEIGMILGISDRTVEKHIARACEIFGVNRRIQAVDCARRLKLISED